MLNYNEILIAFISVVVLSTCAYLLGAFFQILVGKLFLKNQSNNQHLSLFWKVLVGTVLIISSYAIISTKGVTLLLLVPFLMIFFVKHLMLWESKSATAHYFKKEQWLFFIPSIVLNFLFYVWALNSFNSEIVHYVSGDFNIYYRIAQRLNEFGIENLNLDPIYRARYASPYHYGDLWLYALISKLVSTNPSAVFLVSFCHLSVIFVNGIYTYIRRRFNAQGNEKNSYLYFLLLVGFYTGFNTFFPKFIVPSAEPYSLSVMNWSKVLTPSCFLIAMLVLAKDKSWWALCLLTMVGGLFFINALPAMFMTLFLILLIALLRNQISKKDWLVFTSTYAIGTMLFIVFLYKLLPNILGVQMQEATGVALQKSLDIKAFLFTAIKIFIGGWFQIFVLTPFLLILIVGLYIKGHFKHLKQKLFGLDYDILFMIFAIASGLACWAFLHPFAPDAVQFYTNILAPIYAISISFILAYTITVVKNKLLSTIAVLVLGTSIYTHSKEVFFIQKDTRKEWNAIEGFFKNKQSGFYFANLRAARHFNSFFDKNTVYFMPLGQLQYLWPNYHNFSLNAPFISENKESIYAVEERIELDLAPFSIYYNEKRKSDPNISVAQSIQDFVLDQKIGYITVSKDTVLPEYFRAKVKDSVVLDKANLTIYQVQ